LRDSEDQGWSFERFSHIPAFRPESQALVDVAGAGVRLGNFELDFSIPSLPSPVARPLDEEFPDAFAMEAMQISLPR